MEARECWTIVLTGDKDGHPVLPFDSNPEHRDQGFLVYCSEAAAVAAAEYQSNSYDLDCRAMRLDQVDREKALA